MKKVLLYSLSFILLFVAQAASAMVVGPNVCVDITTNLSYKSSNTSVKTLQSFLVANKYMTGAPTGYYGPVTVAAVKKFQIANDLATSGSIDPSTREEIKAITCVNAAFKVQSSANSRIMIPTSAPVMGKAPAMEPRVTLINE